VLKKKFKIVAKFDRQRHSKGLDFQVKNGQNGIGEILAISIALIVLLGLLSDYVFRRASLPGLLGMLLIGILFGPYVFDLIQPELLEVSSDLRMTALIVILLRAGLELRWDTLNRVGGTAVVMATVPAIFEGVAIALLVPPLLGITQIEGAILGSIIAAVSPAVVVPFMIDFIREKRGTKKGIPTLVLSASSVDDVFVIVIFSILLGMAVGGGGAKCRSPVALSR
jgi:NhaP-type Na+/H+ or K+/H+ antiporter